MLRVIKQNISGLKYPLHASLTLSFASFGDAFLYPFLPQYAEVMHIPVVWIGVLLSINRFIRIAFNAVVIKLFASYGVRTMIIIASGMAILSTIGYGLGWGLLSLIIFRLIWGMAYAILRISTMAYAFEHEYIGLSLGVSKCIQETGPLLALWIGPLLLQYFSATDTFLFLAVISVPSFLYAISLPDLKYVPAIEKRAIFTFPSLFNSITFGISFLVDGALIIMTGLFLAGNNASLTNLAITSVVAAFLVYRRACFIFLSPISGVIAGKIGFIRAFSFSFAMIVVGLIFLLVGWVTVGLIIIFTFNSVASTMAPGVAIFNEKDKLKAVAKNATWQDIGAATGALTGGMLLSGSYHFEAFSIATFIIAILLFLYLRKLYKS